MRLETNLRSHELAQSSDVLRHDIHEEMHSNCFIVITEINIVLVRDRWTGYVFNDHYNVILGNTFRDLLP
jgi:hypothetical protein